LKEWSPLAVIFFVAVSFNNLEAAIRHRSLEIFAIILHSCRVLSWHCDHLFIVLDVPLDPSSTVDHADDLMRRIDSDKLKKIKLEIGEVRRERQRDRQTDRE
jgi:hypothetical protein